MVTTSAVSRDEWRRLAARTSENSVAARPWRAGDRSARGAAGGATDGLATTAAVAVAVAAVATAAAAAAETGDVVGGGVVGAALARAAIAGVADDDWVLKALSIRV